MTRMLSLSPQTVLPCSPVEQIDAAARAGFDAVGLRLFPINETEVDVMSDLETQRAIEERLASTGLGVLDIEVVRATPDADLSPIAPALEFASRLGARWLAVTAASLESYDAADEPAVVACLAEMCRIADHHGMRVALEFMAFRGIRTVEDATRVVEAVGHPAIGMSIDALHFFRAGGVSEALMDVDPERIATVHLSDAPRDAPADLINEARQNRLYPGQGGLPLVELLSVLPADLPAGVEVPSTARQILSVDERAAQGARTARELLAAVR
jgi:sugar phosphate isomerase/epimerase